MAGQNPCPAPPPPPPRCVTVCSSPLFVQPCLVHPWVLQDQFSVSISCQNYSLNCMFCHSFITDWQTYVKSRSLKSQGDMQNHLYSAAYAPPAQTCQVHCFCANDSQTGHPVPITGELRLHNQALTCQGHEPDGFKLQYCKCAHSSDKSKSIGASYHLALCFESSQLSLPFISRVLQLGNWQ